MLQESWWANRFRPPPIHELSWWLLLVGTWATLSHALKPMKRPRSPYDGLVAVFRACLFCTPIALSYQLAVVAMMVVGSLPIGAWREFVSGLMLALSRTLGDSYVYIHSKVQSRMAEEPRGSTAWRRSGTHGCGMGAGLASASGLGEMPALALGGRTRGRARLQPGRFAWVVAALFFLAVDAFLRWCDRTAERTDTVLHFSRDRFMDAISRVLAIALLAVPLALWLSVLQPWSRDFPPHRADIGDPCGAGTCYQCRP